MLGNRTMSKHYKNIHDVIRVNPEGDISEWREGMKSLVGLGKAKEVSTHAGQLTTTCRFSSRIPGALFWPRKGAFSHQDNETNGKVRIRVAGNPTLFWLQQSSGKP